MVKGENPFVAACGFAGHDLLLGRDPEMGTENVNVVLHGGVTWWLEGKEMRKKK